MSSHIEDHDHDHHDHHDHHHDYNDTTSTASMFMQMNPLLQAKLLTMLVLCCVSFLLGIIPLKLVRLLNMKVPSCKTHSHGADSPQPLIMSLLLCFGGGVLLFTTFLHLQPEVRESMDRLMDEHKLPEFVEKHSIHFADLVFCAGFFLVYTIEEVVHFLLDLGSHHHEDEAALHRTMSLRRCAKHSYDYERRHKGTMIPRVTLGNPATKGDIPDSSLLSASTTSRQGLLLENGATLKRPHHQLVVDALPQLSTAASSSTDAETVSTAGSSNEITTRKSFRGLFAILALSFHEIFEGLAVGLEHNVQNVWYLFAAIATHKFVLAFCLGVELVSTRTKIPLVIMYICTFAVVTPIGITIGILLSMAKDGGPPEATLVTVILQGIAAGTLLYVTFFEILQREKANAKSGLAQLLAIIIGFMFMICMQLLTDETQNLRGLNRQELHERLTQMQIERRCSVCMDRQKNIIFQCGHGACNICATLVQECHICRESIVMRIPLF